MLKHLLPILVLFGAGCSSFHDKWRSAQTEPLPSNDISGPWEGRWVSDKNQHTGRLRCVMSPAGEGAYDAHFHAVYWKIFRAAYHVPLSARREGDHLVFSGESDLGKLAGGVYTYEGKATTEHFDAKYRSKYDHGRFQMKRPGPR
jgi:hypothetical protein